MKAVAIERASLTGREWQTPIEKIRAVRRGHPPETLVQGDEMGGRARKSPFIRRKQAKHRDGGGQRAKRAHQLIVLLQDLIARKQRLRLAAAQQPQSGTLLR